MTRTPAPRTTTDRRQRGNVLLTTMVLLIPLSAMALVLITVSLDSKEELSTESHQGLALYLAEAGISEAVVSLRAGATGSIASQAAPAVLGDGMLWVEATPLAGDQTRLLAMGLNGTGRVALAVVVDGSRSPRFARGIASKLSTDLATDFFMDSFDSRLGAYASQIAPGNDYALENGTIASNGDITIGAHSVVHGNLRPGPSHLAIVDPLATVTGTTTPAAELFVLQPVSVPVLPAGGALLVDGVLTLPPGDHRFSSLDLTNGSQLIVAGESTIVVDGDVSVTCGAWVTLGQDAKVELYIGGDLSMGTNAGLETPSLDPLRVSVLLSGDLGQTAVIKPHGYFYGTVYGPNASLELGNGLEFFGAAAADHIYAQNPHIRVHYDEALADEGEMTEPTFRALSWLPAAFPDRTLAADRRDPFLLLNVQRDALPRPSQAWHIAGGGE